MQTCGKASCNRHHSPVADSPSIVQYSTHAPNESILLPRCSDDGKKSQARWAIAAPNISSPIIMLTPERLLGGAPDSGVQMSTTITSAHQATSASIASSACISARPNGGSAASTARADATRANSLAEAHSRAHRYGGAIRGSLLAPREPAFSLSPAYPSAGLCSPVSGVCLSCSRDISRHAVANSSGTHASSDVEPANCSTGTRYISREASMRTVVRAKRRRNRSHRAAASAS